MPRSPAKRSEVSAAPDRWERLTLVAFGLALVMVLARATLTESLRDPFEVTPGTQVMLKSPGPASAVGMDLLCCLPALLVLGRRVVDRSYTLRFSWGFVALALLSGWMVLSAAWAADRFGTIVTAFHWFAAAVLLWGASHLVSDWVRLRIVAATCLGLLAICVAQGANYRFHELPELRRTWRIHQAQILEERGYMPGSFAAEQLGKKIEAGEFFGFNASPNSFGALLVMLSIVSAGLLIQRRIDGARPGTIIAAIVIPLALLLVAATRSKTALATPLLATAMLLAIWRFRAQLALRGRQIYLGAVAAVLLAVAATVGHGLAHGKLPGDSLTFRWHYWVGAARILRSSPRLLLIGTAWNNFGLYYLQHRLPQAPEEVKDPHCFIVRFFVELGVIGGVLMSAWMLRLWWEMTQVLPAAHSASPVLRGEGRGEGSNVKGGQSRNSQSNPSPQLAPLGTGQGVPHAFRFIGTVTGVFALFTLWVATDWSQDSTYLLDEVRLRAILGVALMIPAVLGCMAMVQSRLANEENPEGAGPGRSSARRGKRPLAYESSSQNAMQDPLCDDRPAPLLLYAILVGLAIFLIHNLIDFSLFESGPLFVFALLAGSVLGMRRHAEPRPARSGGAWALGIAVIGWLGAAGGLWLPTLWAEHSADAADQALRQKHFAEALQAYTEAAAEQPYNADYFYRAARVAMFASRQEVQPLFAAAISADPMEVRYYLDRARFADAPAHPDRDAMSAVAADYRTAIALYPNNIEARLEFANALLKFGSPQDRQEAREQFAQALSANDKLPAAEVRRLSPEHVQALKQKIRELGG